jgi:hypothetical protein
MVPHALAMVKWKTFRPGGQGGVAVYDYGSDQKRLIEIVGSGGTLWLVTSRKRPKQPRTYHLAYKLIDCYQIPREDSIFSGKWKYVVRAGERGRSVHFQYNDVTETLRRLRFTTGRPMAEVDNTGLRLLTIPELTQSDIDLMERFEHKVLEGRTGFLSYSHRNRIIASRIELELEDRDVSINRDVTFLRTGDDWQKALAKEVMSTDCFIVLISSYAAESKWVHQEVDWAVSEFKTRGLVSRIIPLVLPSGGWESFPQLHSFQHINMPTSASKDFFDKLASDIALAPKSRSSKV